MTIIKKLNFTPLPGLSSRHIQTILHTYLPAGRPPPSQTRVLTLDNLNRLCCEISIPSSWHPQEKTIALIHGLGGSHASNYMIRLARKLYRKHCKIVRINLRGCGSGKGLSHLPYNAGTSNDILQVLNFLKSESPASEITLIGFSLGGSIALKLAGELGSQAEKYVKRFISVCAPLHLGQTLRLIEKKRHALYHSYFLKNFCKQAPGWIEHKSRSIYEFDELVTAPLWGYHSAEDYYHQCSSITYIPQITHETHLLFAEDDPFVSLKVLKNVSLKENVSVWVSKYGGHMGFLGRVPNSKSIFWLDQLLMNWVEGNFSGNEAGIYA